MTVTRSAPGPLGEPTPGGPGFRTNTAAQIERFQHPTTRALLASEGLTTTALERILGTNLSVRVLRQDEIAPFGLPALITGELRPRPADRILIRRSCLVTPDLATASVNYVVAVAQPAAAHGIDDLRTPIGHGLITRGLVQHRRLVWAGVGTWPDGRPCAAKAYVMMLGDRPVCYIREAFNPAVVPPEHAAVSPPEPDLRDEPEPAGPRSVRLQPLRNSPHCARRCPQRVRPEDCAALTVELARAGRGQSFVLHLDGDVPTAANRGAPDAPGDDGATLLYAAAAVVAYLAEVPLVAVDATTSGPGAVATATLERSAELLRRIAPRFGEGRISAVLAELAGLLPVAGTAPLDSRELFASVPRLYISDTMPVPAGDPIRHPRPRRTWDCSAHQLWVPDRMPDSVAALADRVDNCLAVRLGPGTTPGTVELLCRRLNPRNQPGRLSLLAPPGLTGARLAALFAAAANSGAPVCWLCAPTRSAGAATDIRTFFHACRTTGTAAAGLSFPVSDPEWTLRCVLTAVSEMRYTAKALARPSISEETTE